MYLTRTRFRVPGSFLKSRRQASLPMAGRNFKEEPGTQNLVLIRHIYFILNINIRVQVLGSRFHPGIEIPWSIFHPTIHRDACNDVIVDRDSVIVPSTLGSTVAQVGKWQLFASDGFCVFQLLQVKKINKKHFSTCLRANCVT